MGSVNYDQLLKQIPTPVLLKAAKKRNEELREKFGRFASQKIIRKCLKCAFKGGAREMRRHLSEMRQTPSLEHR